MENYKKYLKQRIGFCVAMFCLGSSVFVLLRADFLSKYLPKGNFGDFFEGFQLGVFIAFEICLLVTMVTNSTLLKDEKKLKEHYIKNTDERAVRISELAGGKLYFSLVMPILLAAVIAGYFSAAVFFTLLGVILFIAVMVFSRWLYFSKTM